MDEELRKAVALFRYGLIADVLAAIRRALHEKAQAHPRHAALPRVETMRLASLYRNGGFEALYPKTRADRGQPRRLPPEVATVSLHCRSKPSSKPPANASTTRSPPRPAPTALARRAGQTPRRPRRYRPATLRLPHAGEPSCTDRRSQRRRKTFLIAFIDDATRVPSRTRRTPPRCVFKHAIARRGLPDCSSTRTTAPAARARVRETRHRSDPFPALSTRRAILPHPSRRLARPPHRRSHQPRDVGTLWAWVEGEYHHSPHRGLDGRTPSTNGPSQATVALPRPRHRPTSSSSNAAT